MRSNWSGLCLSALLVAAPSAAFAQADNSSGVALFNQCAEIRDDAQRLSCFDRVTRQMRETTRPNATATGPSPASPRATEQARARNEREDFGLNAAKVEERQRVRQPDRAKPINRITARIAAAKPFGAGYWAILLEDGAIWEFTDLPDNNFLPPRDGDTITIRRGMMGSYLLYLRGQAGIRVRRAS